jgi:hypothetical protein
LLLYTSDQLSHLSVPEPVVYLIAQGVALRRRLHEALMARPVEEADLAGALLDGRGLVVGRPRRGAALTRKLGAVGIVSERGADGESPMLITACGCAGPSTTSSTRESYYNFSTHFGSCSYRASPISC